MAAKRKRRKTRKRKTAKRKRTYSKRRRNPKRRTKRRTTYKRKASKRRRRRRNPGLKDIKGLFGLGRMTFLLAGLGGIGVGALSKAFAVNIITNPLFSKFYGALLIAGSAIMITKRKKGPKISATRKALAGGIALYGLYDLLTVNVPILAAYLPTITGPSFLAPGQAEAVEDISGGMSYGRSVMGSAINSGRIQTVGSSINLSEPEIISSDIDIADALEMSLD